MEQVMEQAQQVFTGGIMNISALDAEWGTGSIATRKIVSMLEKMEEQVLRCIFDDKFREAVYKQYPEQIASGKIYETEHGWVGLKLKK